MSKQTVTRIDVHAGSGPSLHFSTGRPELGYDAPTVYAFVDCHPGGTRGLFSRMTVVEKATLKALCQEIVDSIDDEPAITTLDGTRVR